MVLSLLLSLLIAPAFSGSHVSDERMRLMVKSDFIREISEASFKPTEFSFKSPGAEVKNPRWFCRENKVVQPWKQYLEKLQAPENVAELKSYEKYLGGEAGFDKALEALVELPQAEWLLRGEELVRQYAIFASPQSPSFPVYVRATLTLLKLCLNHSANAKTCCFYADRYQELCLSGGVAVSPAASCSLAKGYFLEGNTEKANQFAQQCNEKEALEKFKAQLTQSAIFDRWVALTTLALNNNPLDEDRYHRLLSSIPESELPDFREFLKTLGIEAPTDCDLMRLPKIRLTAAILQTVGAKYPTLLDALIDKLGEHPSWAQEALGTQPLADQLKRLLAGRPNAKLLVHLNAKDRQEVKELTELTHFLSRSEIVDSRIVRVGYKDEDEFRERPEFRKLAAMLASMDRDRKTGLTFAQLAKDRLKSDPKLQKLWNENYERDHQNKVTVAARTAFQAWRKGEFSDISLMHYLNRLQFSLPNNTELKRSLKNLAAKAASFSHFAGYDDLLQMGDGPSVEMATDIGARFPHVVEQYLHSKSAVAKEMAATWEILEQGEIHPDSKKPIEALLRENKPKEAKAKLLELLAKMAVGQSEPKLLYSSQKEQALKLISLLGKDSVQFKGEIFEGIKNDIGGAWGAFQHVAKENPRLISELLATAPTWEKESLRKLLYHFSNSEMAHPQNVPSLMKIYADSKDIDITVAALAALAAAPDESILPLLVDAKYSSHRSFRERGEAGLEKIGYREGQPTEALARELTKHVPRLLHQLSEDAKTRSYGGYYALQELGPIAKSAIPALKENLKAENEGLQLQSALLLVGMGERSELPRLLQVLEDGGERAHLVADVLGHADFETERVTQALIKMLNKGGPYETSAALSGLAALAGKSPLALPAILSVLENEKSEIYPIKDALRELASLNAQGPEVVRALNRLIDRGHLKNLEILREAEPLIRKQKEADAVELVFHAKEGGDQWGVWTRHIYGMKEKGMAFLPELLPLALTHDWSRNSPVETFEWQSVRDMAASSPDKAVPQIIKAIQSHPGAYHEAGAAMLGELGPRKDSVLALTRLLETHPHPNSIVALGKMGREAKSAVPLLLKQIEDNPVVTARALELIGEPYPEAGNRLASAFNKMQRPSNEEDLQLMRSLLVVGADPNVRKTQSTKRFRSDSSAVRKAAAQLFFDDITPADAKILDDLQGKMTPELFDAIQTAAKKNPEIFRPWLNGSTRFEYDPWMRSSLNMLRFQLNSQSKAN